MKSFFLSTAVAVSMLTSSVLAADNFSSSIKTYDDSVKASSLARDWFEGNLPKSNYKVTYDGPPIVLRYSSHIVENNSYENDMKKAFAQLTRDTNGKIVFKGYYAQSLHPQKEGFLAAKNNVVDWAACFVLNEPKSFKLMQAVSLPGIFSDAAAATRAYMEVYPKYMAKEYERFGVYMGRTMITPSYNLIGNKSFKTVNDFKGVKIGANGRMVDVVKSLGGVPVTGPSAEAFTALQNKLVDVQAFNDPAMLIFKLYEVSNSYTKLSVNNVAIEYCVNPTWFNALPEDLKPIFTHWAQKLNVAMVQAHYETGSRKAVDLFRSRGMTITELSAKDQKEVVERTNAITEQWIKDMEAEGLPARALVDDLRAAAKKYGAMTWNQVMKDIIDNPIPNYLSKGH
jgi:TRAP-type C4-dicarboxylate transport system substrate-binding protein